MEQGKKIRIIINHKEILIEAIDKFNRLHDTDFKFLEFINDEVNFAYVGYVCATENNVFDFGFQFGKLIMHLRNTNKIKG